MTTVPPQVEPSSVDAIGPDESNFEQQEVAGLSQAQIVRRRFFRHRAAMISLFVLIFIILLATTSIGWGFIPGWWKWNYYTSVGSASGRAGHAGDPGHRRSASVLDGRFPVRGGRCARVRQLRPGHARNPTDAGGRLRDGTALDHHRCGDRRAGRLLPRLGRFGRHAVHRPDHHPADRADHRRAGCGVQRPRRLVGGAGARLAVLDPARPPGPRRVPDPARARVRRRCPSGRRLRRAGSSSNTSCPTRSTSSWSTPPW